MDAPFILIVEDDADIAALVTDHLSANGLRARATMDGVGMNRALQEQIPDLIVLDIMLPGESGLSIAKRLRRDTSIPIIILTAAGEETDLVHGLEIGADDYVTKPFGLRELLARIRAVLRRTSHARGSELPPLSFVFDGWRLRPDTRELIDPDAVQVSLTSAEFSLLKVFCEHPRRVLTRDQLLDRTHGHGDAPFDRSIDTLISRIRQKVEREPRSPQYLKTIRMEGYIFDCEVTRL